MKFDFLKPNKKTSLALGGLLVVLSFAALTVWFYMDFLVSQDPFLDRAPAETVFYWHQSPGEKMDCPWLYNASSQMLLGEAAGQAEFLFKNVIPRSRETSFAILPGFEDFIFWGQIETRPFNELKKELEESNFNYVFEDGGKITITNTKFSLKEVLGALSQKNFSLADDKTRLIAFNRAVRRFPVQVYLNGNFQYRNFYPLELESDFWVVNELIVAPKDKGKNEFQDNVKGYDYFAAIGGPHTLKNIEEVLKKNLAVLLPEIREKVLQDKTVVKEMVANPDRFKLEKDSVAGREITFFDVQELNLRLYLANLDEKLILATNKELFTNYLANPEHKEEYYGIGLGDFLLKWAGAVTADFGGIVLGVNVDKL